MFNLLTMIGNHKLKILWTVFYDIFLMTLPDLTCAVPFCNSSQDDPVLAYLITRNVSTILKEPIEIPSTLRSTSTIIFLNEFGEDGKSRREDLLHLQQEYTRMLFPQANYMNIAWKNRTNITSWCNFGGDTHPEMKNLTKEFQEAANYVYMLIDNETERGISSDRIILAGIGQGALLALHSALTYQEPLAAVVALSPWHPLPWIKHYEPLYELNRGLPIFLANLNGTSYVSNKTLENVNDHLGRYFSFKTALKTYDGQNRTDAEILQDAAEFCMNYVYYL